MRVEWRLYKERTLAYKLGPAEIERLRQAPHRFGPEEALLIVTHEITGEPPTVAAYSAAGGGEWGSEHLDPDKRFEILIVPVNPFQLLCHLCFINYDGDEFRGVLKLSVSVEQERVWNLMELMGERAAVTDLDLLERLDAELAKGVGGALELMGSEELKQGTSGLATVKKSVIRTIKKVLSSVGCSPNGASLAWAHNPGVASAMANAANKQREANAVFAAHRDRTEQALALTRTEEAKTLARKVSERKASERATAEREIAARSGSDAKEAVQGKSASQELKPAIEIPLPDFTAGEGDTGTYSWRTYGGHTLVRRLEDSEVPQLFGKGFALFADDALFAFHQGRCLGVMTQGTERTGSMLIWVGKHFAKGDELTVVVSATTPFELRFDLEGMDIEGDQVVCEVSAKLNVEPSAAKGLDTNFEGRSVVAREDLQEELRQGMQEFFSREVSLATSQRAQREHLKSQLKGRFVSRLGFLGFSTLGFNVIWAEEDEAFERIEASAAKRYLDLWRLNEARILPEADRDYDLQLFLIENANALSEELVRTAPNERRLKMLMRAVMGRDALKGDIPDVDEVEGLVRKAKEEVATLQASLREARTKVQSAFDVGPPERAPRVMAVEESSEDEEYLSGEWGGSMSGDELSDFSFYTNSGMVASPLSEMPASPKPPVSNGGGRRALAPSALGGGSAAKDEPLPTSLQVGGAGVKVSSISRCPHCMAPVSLGSGYSVCNNCGRDL